MPDSALHWIGLVCAERRAAADIHRATIASELRVNQETVARFERGQTWPRDIDQFVSTYAAHVDATPLELWQDALTRWAANP